MKKNYFLYSLFCTHITLFSAAPMEEPEIIQESQKTFTIPTFLKKFNNLESAKKFILQKINCLVVTEAQCTKTDLLTMSYGLGFLAGTHAPILIVANIVQKYGKVDNLGKLYLAQVLAEFIALALGLRGAAMQPLLSVISNELKTFLLLVADLAGLIYQGYETSSITFFVKSLGQYVAMNAKCIWSESYCKPSIAQATSFKETLSDFGRRRALYFWLGFISGTATRKGVGFAMKKLPLLIPQHG